MLVASPIHQMLDLARWAPSGDNTQPWRFEIIDDRQLVIHGRDTREHCIYDLDGRASQLSLGTLIETLAIAASAHGLRLTATLRSGMPETRPTFDVALGPDLALGTSPLLTAIPWRSAQRRPLRTRSLSAAELDALRAAVGPAHELLVFDGLAARSRWAALLWANAGIRLRLPEAFELHRSIIRWDARFSADRIPDQALGAAAPTLALMRWAMSSWHRVSFLNRWLGGTIAPRLEMDLLPALACGAHVAILAADPPRDIPDYVAAGRCVQRFWLTATRLGLHHQPAMTPLIFDRYLREDRPFSAESRLVEQAGSMAARLNILLDGRAARAIWLGRIGAGRPPLARSVRKPLRELIVGSNPAAGLAEI